MVEPCMIESLISIVFCFPELAGMVVIVFNHAGSNYFHGTVDH